MSQEEIYSSSYAAAAYLKSINFPQDKKVYIVGQEGIQVRVFVSMGGHLVLLNRLHQGR